MQFSNKVYDRLKFFTLVGLPALAAFYLGLGQLWGFPETEKVGTSIVLLATLLGTLLQISNSKYKNEDDGTMEYTGVNSDTGVPDLKLTVAPHVVAEAEQQIKKGEVRLKVKNTSGAPIKNMEIPEDVEIEEH